MPCRAASDRHIQGSFKSEDKIDELAAMSDVLTVEIEHINAEAYGAAAVRAGIPAEPKPETVQLIQDKYAQKLHMKQQGVPIGDFARVENAAVLATLGEVRVHLGVSLAVVTTQNVRCVCRRGGFQ